MKKETNSPFFLESVSHCSLVELATVCRDDRKIGLCFGKPGIGKTFSAKRFSNWQTVEANLTARNAVALEAKSMMLCDSVYYLPSVTVSASRLRVELSQLKNQFEDAYLKAVSYHSPDDWACELQKQHLKLIIVDEAFRLKYQALEQLRDIQEQWDVGLMLIGDPGFERSLSKMWHFSVRVAHAEELKPLTAVETSLYIDKQLEVMKLSKPPEEVYTLIHWYTQGVLRTLVNLFSMIARILKINEDVVREITSDVVEAAREMMMFGLNGAASKQASLLMPES
jgi:type II secretory pathway predicted ATPase ExeA